MKIEQLILNVVSIYMSKMSGRNHENWITNFDGISYQNFSLKTKFILDFFIYIDYISWVYTIHMLYMF